MAIVTSYYILLNYNILAANCQIFINRYYHILIVESIKKLGFAPFPASNQYSRFALKRPLEGFLQDPTQRLFRSSSWTLVISWRKRPPCPEYLEGESQKSRGFPGGKIENQGGLFVFEGKEEVPRFSGFWRREAEKQESMRGES